MHVCVCARVFCVRVYVCMCVHSCVCEYECVYVCVFACAYVLVHVSYEPPFQVVPKKNWTRATAELKVLKEVNHQNVVRFFDFFDAQEVMYIVME